MTTYTRTARSLHWLIALLILAVFSLGLYMHELPLSPDKLRLYSWHKWAGVSVFLLVVFRLAWRISHRPPALPASMSSQDQWLAHAGHLALYALMFAVPLTGWLMSSAKGFQTVWFGLLPIPDLLSKDKALGDTLQWLHWALNMALALTVLGHLGAALKHHFVNKDEVMSRMLPFLARR